MESLSFKDTILGRPITCGKHNLETRSGKDYASVVFVGDVHLGSPECDEERFARQLIHCHNEGLYVFLMGDLLESSTRHSVGAGVYEQARTAYGTIQLQHEAMCEYLRPLADKGLILGSLSGNHENRVYNLTGVSIAKALCRELRIPFLGDAGWNYWRVGKQGYTLYTLHGSSGSRFMHTKLKAVADISHSFAADVIAMGHVHTCVDAYQLVQYFCRKDRVIKERKKLLLITGHYLRYLGYAKMKGMPIEKLGSPKVKFFKDRMDTHVSW